MEHLSSMETGGSQSVGKIFSQTLHHQFHENCSGPSVVIAEETHYKKVRAAKYRFVIINSCFKVSRVEYLMNTTSNLMPKYQTNLC